MAYQKPIDERRLAQKLGLYETAKKLGVTEALRAYARLAPEDVLLTLAEIEGTLLSLTRGEKLNAGSSWVDWT
jgi:hypothetical protein